VVTSLGGSVYDPSDAVGRLRFSVLAVVATFESDLIRLQTREGMKVARAKGRLRGEQPKLNRRQEAHLVTLVHSGDSRLLGSGSGQREAAHGVMAGEDDIAGGERESLHHPAGRHTSGS
jgi:DNA invertase Pin-like site-specific DNA recombinase